MEKREIIHLSVALLILTFVISFTSIINYNLPKISLGFLFAFVILGINVLAKKLTARALNLEAINELWESRAAFTKKKVYWGIILPLIISLVSIGTVQLMTILSYDTTARKKTRKKLGIYSVTELTGWHNSLIAVSGIISALLISFISYWIPNLEQLFQMAAFYAFFNTIPISRLDGNQIFNGSKIAWTILAMITAIFAAYAIILT